MCSCLRGFEPKNMEEWSRGNWSSGCVRKKLLQCERINQTGKVAKEDEFLKLETMKLPDFAVRSSVTLESCREQCLNNCSCIAYAYVVGIGCMTWMGSLIDLNKFPSEGADLYIRLAHSELEKEDNKVVVIVPVVVAIITSAICTFFLCRWLAKRKALKKKRTVVKLDTADACTKFCGKNLNDAWKLWNENNIVALIDPVISHPCFQSEISRCIHVGLLCVQEFVKDRPTMSTVISMLNSEIVDLPTPKQPAFTERRNAVEESSEQSQKRCSVNYVTVTVTEAR
ncbi:hypothetical protein JRO89_XS11G0129600 [Xanthoceras sorbifolium]|uniref:Apple domain-containing protein n=1 Tax=Xanthoceras sorbifolium TaxID=99658 RepID=A0ABQ8HFD8_9ROSI|nr:hypothetical protein JRO89_XS11G0129600 [Xanthoceras sorbifolium]